MFTLTFNTDNDAFADGDCAREIARICRTIGDRIARGDTTGKVRDVNGNTIGAYAYHDGEYDAPRVPR
jgi:hypothetical protein